MNKLETLKDIIADKYDGCYEVTRECVKAYANVDTALLDLKDLDLVLMIPIGTWTFLNDKKKELVYASHLDAEAKERIASLMDVVNQKSIDGEYEHTQEDAKEGGISSQGARRCKGRMLGYVRYGIPFYYSCL